MASPIPDSTPRPIDHLPLMGRPDDPAIDARFGSMDYSALELAIGKLAASLRAQGLAPGDRIASWTGKGRLACLLPLAAPRAGLIHVPVNPLLKRGQVAHIVADSGARMLIAHAQRLASLEEGDVTADCLLRTEEAAEQAGEAAEVPLPPSDQPTDGLAAILYTSGSTGKPKGVMLSHANLWLGAISVRTYLRLARDDRTLCVLPLSFDYGQNQLLSTWAAGGCVLPFDYLLPRDMVRAVGRERITTLAGVPPLWVDLAAQTWPEGSADSLRRITNSGGALTRPLVTALRGLFPGAKLHAMYGLTEAFRSTALDPALIDSHPESIGKAVPFAEILVAGADGRDPGGACEGELVHCGPLVAQGYWRDAERTALRFRPSPMGAQHPGMSVWSGDKVRRDAEGLLYFVGRDDMMIKSMGNRISGEEIEVEAVAVAGVAEAVAFGRPDPRAGMLVCLAVRLLPDAPPVQTEEALRAHLRGALPGFMQPAMIVLVDQFPRTPNGKLDRVAIAAEHGA